MRVEDAVPLPPLQDGRRRRAGGRQHLGDALRAQVALGQRQQQTVAITDRPQREHEAGERPLGRFGLREPRAVRQRAAQRLGRLLRKRLQQRLPPREVTEQSAPYDSRGPRQLLQRDVRVPPELLTGRGQDALPVGPRIAPQRLAGDGLGHGNLDGSGRIHVRGFSHDGLTHLTRSRRPGHRAAAAAGRSPRRCLRRGRAVVLDTGAPSSRAARRPRAAHPVVSFPAPCGLEPQDRRHLEAALGRLRRRGRVHAEPATLRDRGGAGLRCRPRSAEESPRSRAAQRPRTPAPLTPPPPPPRRAAAAAKPSSPRNRPRGVGPRGVRRRSSGPVRACPSRRSRGSARPGRRGRRW